MGSGGLVSEAHKRTRINFSVQEKGRKAASSHALQLCVVSTSLRMVRLMTHIEDREGWSFSTAVTFQL